MLSLEEALALFAGEVDRPMLEAYVAHAWVRPLRQQDGWRFEEIDVARIRLVRHLQHHLLIDEHGMDIVLHLLDQMYELRRRYGLQAHDEATISATEFWEVQEEF